MDTASPSSLQPLCALCALCGGLPHASTSRTSFWPVTAAVPLSVQGEGNVAGSDGESTAEVAEDAEREQEEEVVVEEEREEEEETEWTLPPRPPSNLSALSALSAVDFLTLPPPEHQSGRSRPR